MASVVVIVIAITRLLKPTNHDTVTKTSSKPLFFLRKTKSQQLIKYEKKKKKKKTDLNVGLSKENDQMDFLIFRSCATECSFVTLF